MFILALSPAQCFTYETSRQHELCQCCHSGETPQHPAALDMRLLRRRLQGSPQQDCPHQPLVSPVPAAPSPLPHTH